MKPLWCILALALIGADDPRSNTPKPPISPNEPAIVSLEAQPQECLKDAISNAPKGASPAPCEAAQAKETWALSLDTAIWIALDNCEIVRTIPLSFRDDVCVLGTDGENARPPTVICRLDQDSSIWRFKAEVTALVRSVEQQYWNLAQAQAQVSSIKQAVKTTDDVLAKEQADLTTGRGTFASVAEAAQRLEQLNLELASRTSDVTTVERQLRELLGLPPADNRQIVPSTKPTEELIEYELESCMQEMSQGEPEVVEQKLAMGTLDPIVAKLIDQRSDKLTAAKSQKSNAKFAPAKRESKLRQVQQKKDLQQIVQQRTHSLVKCFIEVDASFKQYQQSKRVRAAAADRLAEQRKSHEKGGITIDRFLDAVSQNATAVATEAQYLSAYNTALAALGEAKGTLLAERNVIVADTLRRPKARKSDNVKTAKLEPAVKAVDSPKSLRSLTSTMVAPNPTKPALRGEQEAQETWPMTLQEAIRIGLDNSEIVRVIAFGAEGIPIGGFYPLPVNGDATQPGMRAGPAAGQKANRAPIVIARLDADASVWRFQAEVMAHLRSIEQVYWTLAQVHVQLWSADRAVSLADEILKREQDELVIGQGTVADVAEAAQRLEQFKLDLITRTSDVITTERQLRNLLGLPPADNRRIIPVTPPD